MLLRALVLLALAFPGVSLGATGQKTGSSAVNATAQDVSDRSVKATGSSTGRALKDRFADVVNVRDFGAKGDNSTNDQPAFAAAVAAACSAGGGEISVPPGVYYVGSAVQITCDAVTLSGSNSYARPTITTKGGAYPAIEVLGISPSTWRRHVRIKRLGVTGQIHAFMAVDFGTDDVVASAGYTHTLWLDGGWSHNFIASQFLQAANGSDVYLSSPAAVAAREINSLDFVSCRIEGGSKSGIASEAATKVQALTLHGGIVEGHADATNGWGLDIPLGNLINAFGTYFEANRAGNIRLGAAATAVQGAAFSGILNSGFGDPNPRPAVGINLVNAQGVTIDGRHVGFSGDWLRVEPASSGVRVGGAEYLENFPGGSNGATLLGSSARSGIAGANIARNGTMEVWGSGLPAGFGKSNGTETIAQESTTKNLGAYSASVTNAAASSGSLFQRWDVANRIPGIKGHVVFFSVLVNSSDANRARLRVDDGVGSATSLAHPGDGQWHVVTVPLTISATATTLTARLEITSGSAVTAYFDDFIAIVDADTSANRGPALADQLGFYVGTGSCTGSGPYTATITHNLDAAAYRVLVTPASNVTSWVTGKSFTQFTVNCSAAASFDYLMIPQ